MKILDLHFSLTEQAAEAFKFKDQPVFQSKFEEICRSLIVISRQACIAFKREYPNSQLPHHQGYEQLCEMLAMKGDFDAAVDLCHQAQAQGWAGDWNANVVRFCEYRFAWGLVHPLIAGSPGMLQTDLYRICPAVSKESICYVIYCAAKRGHILREKMGRSYRLQLVDPSPVQGNPGLAPGRTA